MYLRPSHTARNSRKRMNHAQNLVVRACPSRIWPFLLTYVMKNHRWIAQELRKDHAQITNKPRTSAHRHEKALNRANAWFCAWRICDGKPRIISALSLVNCVWIAHDSRMDCAKNAQEALKLRSFRAYKTDAAAVPWLPFKQSQAAHRFFKFIKFSFFIRVRATQNSDHKWVLSNIGFITVHGQNM